MNIGIHYTLFEDIALILYALHSGEIILEDYKKTPFKIKYGEDTYHFAKNLDDINHCDKKIRGYSALGHYLYHHNSNLNQYDKIIVSRTMDAFQESFLKLKSYLKEGNICLTGNENFPDPRDPPIKFEHENLVYEPMFGLVVVYYYLGFQFLNYHKFDKKDHLLGVYKQKLHISGNPSSFRDEMSDQVQTILGDDFFYYPRKEYKTRELIEPSQRTNLWQGVHMSGYTDYTTSVCNLVFETGSASDVRSHITEKTLKAIIFCEENIFFMLHCPHPNFKRLRDFGFWFLNTEFYDIDYSDPGQEIDNSIIKATTFLKELKDNLGSNKLVYDHLMTLYGHNLQNNVTLFYDLLYNCRHTDKILELIKK